jgi:hypothetical protein
MPNTYDEIAHELQHIHGMMAETNEYHRFGNEGDARRQTIYKRLRDVTDKLGACLLYPAVPATKSYGREIDNLALALRLAKEKR